MSKILIFIQYQRYWLKNKIKRNNLKMVFLCITTNSCSFRNVELVKWFTSLIYSHIIIEYRALMIFMIKISKKTSLTTCSAFLLQVFFFAWTSQIKQHFISQENTKNINYQILKISISEIVKLLILC